jgi:hypothetical protein
MKQRRETHTRNKQTLKIHQRKKLLTWFFLVFLLTLFFSCQVASSRQFTTACGPVYHSRSLRSGHIEISAVERLFRCQTVQRRSRASSSQKRSPGLIFGHNVVLETLSQKHVVRRVCNEKKFTKTARPGPCFLNFSHECSRRRAVQISS